MKDPLNCVGMPNVSLRYGWYRARVATFARNPDDDKDLAG